jgi:hypothetical protein
MKNANQWIERKLASLENNKDFKKLDLSNAGLTDQDVTFLCDKLDDRSIYIGKLDLSNNILTAVSAKALINLKKVESLDVSNNYLRDEGVKILNTSKCFKSINTCGNGVTKEITTEEENFIESLTPHTDNIDDTNNSIFESQEKTMYKFCLMSGKDPIKGEFYIEINEDSLDYKVLDPKGEIKTGNISQKELGITLGNFSKIDIDEVKKISSKILNITSEAGHTFLASTEKELPPQLAISSWKDKKTPLSFLFKNEGLMILEKEKKSPRDLTREGLKKFFDENKENIEKLSPEEMTELYEEFLNSLKKLNLLNLKRTNL